MARVYNKANVLGCALVYDKACIYGNAFIDGHANIYGSAQVYGRAWVGHNTKVYNTAQVHDTAKIYEYAEIYGNTDVCGDTKIYGDAKVYDEAKIYGRAEIYDSAQVYGKAKVHSNVDIYDSAEVCGDAELYGNAKVHGTMIINSGTYADGDYYKDNSANDTLKNAVQKFICTSAGSNSLTVQTNYESIDKFVNTSITNDVDLDTLTICVVDTKESLIILQKVEVENKTTFKFIVDITNEDNDDFRFRSIIRSQEHLHQLIRQTIEALKLYPKFNKYAEILDELTV